MNDKICPICSEPYTVLSYDFEFGASIYIHELISTHNITKRCLGPSSIAKANQTNDDHTRFGQEL